ncbi:hypothetical protein [Microbacterium sp. As-52]|uniref:hypothetical protein n=1 Tax=Microbacterium sp. As-52 TaxID=3390503 RepID=UPI003CEEFF66
MINMRLAETRSRAHTGSRLIGNAAAVTQKRRRLTLAEQVRAEAARDQVRTDRSRWVRQALVDASVALLPQRYRDRYNGDVSLDSTNVPILGKVHSRATTLVRNGKPLNDPEVLEYSKTLSPGGLATNVDFSAGTYNHEHRDDKPKAPPIPAFEMDIVTMMDTEGYDEKRHPAFCRLITGIGFHRPGNIKHEPREAMHQHSRSFEQRGIAAADRAFNGQKPENFQQPLRIDGWEFAFDYKKDQFGVQATVPGYRVIVVDGALYVDYMPKRLRYITYWFHNDQADPDTGELFTRQDVEDAIEARKAYALKRHGNIRSEEAHRGKQRFTYPEPRTYIAFDPATGKRISATKNNLRGSLQLDPHADVVRHLQRYPWGTSEWKQAYGQRNQVESVNKSIKHTRFTDLESAAKRPGRGETYHSLATALMAVAYNVRVLVRALIQECTPAGKRRRKSKKRYSAANERNVRPATREPLAPPA